MNARKNFCRKGKEMKVSEALFDRTRRSAAQNWLVNRAIHEVWPSIETLSKCRRILKEFPNKTLISQHILLFARYARNSQANFKSNKLLKLAILTNFSLADHLRPIKILSPTGS
jgi:hypothetical protein